MPSFTGGPDFRTPFGINVWLRSTQDIKTVSRTVAASTITSVTIDGFANQKSLPKGMVLALIATGADAGKVGPYQPASGADVTTVSITGTPTGGTFTLTLAAEGSPPDGIFSQAGVTTAAIAFNATATAVKNALEALDGVTVGQDFTVTGGPGPGTPYVITAKAGGAFDEIPLTWTHTDSLTGGASPAVAIAHTTPGGGTAGATDGRADPRNIVGINNTFLPYQLEYRDVEVACVYDAAAVAAWVLMYNSAGVPVPIDVETERALRFAINLNILFP